MILCITPNAALDRTVVVPNFSAGAVYRAQQVSVKAGGKGLNVARALKVFGKQVTCTGFVGGHNGVIFTELAAHEGLEGVWTQIDGDTRICTSIADPNNGETTVVNEPGPTANADDWLRFRQDVLNVAIHASQICISGSLPPASPLDSFVDFIQALKNNSQNVWVDTSGSALSAALRAKPTGIKINHLEAAEMLEMNIHTPQEAADAARLIQNQGVKTVIITMGKMGAVLTGDAGTFHATSPQIQPVSTVGSGDTFFAGLMNGLADDCSNAEALRMAVAAGAANALTIGGGYFKLDDFEHILSRTNML